MAPVFKGTESVNGLWIEWWDWRKVFSMGMGGRIPHLCPDLPPSLAYLKGTEAQRDEATSPRWQEGLVHTVSCPGGVFLQCHSVPFFLWPVVSFRKLRTSQAHRSLIHLLYFYSCDSQVLLQTWSAFPIHLCPIFFLWNPRLAECFAHRRLFSVSYSSCVYLQFGASVSLFTCASWCQDQDGR